MTEVAQGRRAALRADGMASNQTGERTGSRPKPPEAGARSASIEPGLSPGYSSTTQLLSLILSPRGEENFNEHSFPHPSIHTLAKRGMRKGLKPLTFARTAWTLVSDPKGRA